MAASEYVNFSSADLNKSGVFNEKEGSILEGSRTARNNFRGRSIESIRSYPHKMYSLSANNVGQLLVSDNILLGGKNEASDNKLLRKLGVTHVLNVAQQLPNYFPNEYLYLKIPLLDTEDCNIRECLPLATKFLNHVLEVNGRVLVHCISGVSRSVILLAMYFISSHAMTLKDIYRYVRAVRPQINPNVGFRFQAIKLEIDKLGGSSVAADKDKVWDFYQFNSIRHDVVQIFSGELSPADTKDNANSDLIVVTPQPNADYLDHYGEFESGGCCLVC